MKWLLAGGLLIHGLIHLMGFARAFGYADLPALTLPISRPLGLAWLLASGLFAGAAVALVRWPRGWWGFGALAVVVSQGVIISSWRDAKAGMLANGIALVLVAHGYASQGPGSLRRRFEADVAEGLARGSVAPVLTEADVAGLPPALRRYLALTGAVGAPRARNFHLRFRGRIRGGPTEAWMDFSGEQYNFYGPPSRLFTMHASKAGVPFEVFHRFADGAAAMQVRIASLIPVVDARGPQMTQAETVTLFNDMCLFAPGSLVDPAIQWLEVGPLTVSGRYTHAGVTVSALLTFNPSGELEDFVSDDRLQGSADGKSFTPMRWSTPVRDYRSFGSHRVGATGVGRWHPKDSAAWDYIELFVEGIEHNVRPG